jgi:multidrug efflux pump subunit AcrA (membrane-fusion protein)
VKVAIKAPPPTIRPDMLAQVTFLALPAPQKDEAPAAGLRLLVPRALIGTGEGGARVWLADQLAGVARYRAVKLGPALGDLIEVVDGLNPGDRLIAVGREGLRDGERIAVTAEEAPAAATVGPAPASHPARLQPASGGQGARH